MPNSKWIAGAVALVILLGGLGGIFFDRLVFPYLSTLATFRGVQFFRGNAPLVINRREEVLIDEGLNQAALAERAKSSLVTIYVHDGAFRSAQFRLADFRTGVAVSADGLIATPLGGLSHPGAEYTVVLSSGDVRAAQLMATDKFTGLSLLKINDQPLPVMKQGSSKSEEPGEKVLSLWATEDIGSLALGAATVSVPAREAAGFSRVYDFDAPTGRLVLDSLPASQTEGAAVVDKDGQLLGVVVSNPGGARVLPIEYLNLLLDNYLDDHVVVWPGWKLSYSVYGPSQTALAGLPGKYGVLIRSGGAVLHEGDFVFRVDGADLSPDVPFQMTMLSKKPGTKVKFRIIRDGAEKEVEAQL